MAGGTQAALADAIEADLRQIGDPLRAQQEKRYLKSDLVFFGVGAPKLKQEVSTWLSLWKPRLDHDLVVGLGDDLWGRGIHECRAFALTLLDRCKRHLGPSDVALFERWVRESKTWAYVDYLATKHIPRVLEGHATRAEILDRWAADEDFWVRRTALLALLPGLKAGVADWDAEWVRFTRYALAMLGEKEFFIRKAIGWVLREVSKNRPEPVRAFVAEHGEGMSGVTRREAVKYL